MNKILYFVSIVAMLVACNTDDEKVLEPSDSVGNFMTIETALKQGSGKFKTQIQRYYDNYDCLLCYEFPEGMLHYNGNSTLTKRYYTSAHEAHMENVLNLFEGYINYFPKEYTKIIVPRYVFIVDSLATVENKKSLLWADSQGLEKIILGGGGTITGTVLQEQLTLPKGAGGTFRAKLCVPLLQKLFKQGHLSISEKYRDIVYYNEQSGMTEVSLSTYKKYGFISNPSSTVKKTKLSLVEWDFDKYMQELVMLGKEQFEAKYLIPTFDVEGKIKEKYNLFLAIFREVYNIDIEQLTANSALNPN